MNIHSKSAAKKLQLLLFIALVLVGSQAFAAGTTSGDYVGNSATLNFDVGGVTQDDLISSPSGNDDPALTLQAGAPGTTPGVGEVGYTEFIVDRVLDVLVVADNGDNVPVVPEEIRPALAFTVTNQGNATADIYLMAVYNDAASEGTITGYTNTATEYFRAGISGTNTIEYYLDVNNDNAYDGGDTALPTSGGIPYLDEMTEDESRDVIVVIDVLSTSAELISDVTTNEITTVAELNGARSAITLVAQVGDDTGPGADGVITNDDNNRASPGGTPSGSIADVNSTVQDVFGDNAALNGVVADTINTEDATYDFVGNAGDNQAEGGFGSETTDVELNGQASDTSAFIFSTPEITLTKAVSTVCDDINGDTNPKAIPGAISEYVITIANAAGAGIASADLTTLADTLDTDVTFDDDFLDASGGAATCDVNAATNAVGDGFLLSCTDNGSGTSRACTTPIYFTTASDGDGATAAAGVISIDFTNLLPAEGDHTAGEMEQGDSITITFQTFIN